MLNTQVKSYREVRAPLLLTLFSHQLLPSHTLSIDGHLFWAEIQHMLNRRLIFEVEIPQSSWPNCVYTRNTDLHLLTSITYNDYQMRELTTPIRCVQEVGDLRDSLNSEVERLKSVGFLINLWHAYKVQQMLCSHVS